MTAGSAGPDGQAAGRRAGSSETTGAVHLSIFVEARPETVFAILSQPARLGEWMMGEASFESTPGSRFSIRFPRFDTTVAGEVVELVRDRRACFTWGVAEGPQAATVPAGSTRVEFSLEPEGDGTRLTIDHVGFDSGEERANHEVGWRFHGNRMALLANRAELSAVMDALTSAFFGAWNEPDREARLALLASCCAEQVEFQDEYAAFVGRDKLSQHIGSTQTHVPEARFELDGTPGICRGDVLIPWRLVSPDGEVTHRGTDYARVSPDGLIQRLTGFWTA